MQPQFYFKENIMKNVKYCWVCGAKKVIHSFKLNRATVEPYNNGVALTPPMGWSSWNLFRNKINEKLFREIADAMVKSGLKDAGYKYVNIDDCWQSSSRDKDGRLQADFITFPSGMKKLASDINEMGLELGIYSSNGTLTCEEYPGSLDHEDIDAETFAEWGVGYFKYDFCHHVYIPTEAPFIVSLSIGKKGEDDFYKALAGDATLDGNARLIEDKEVEGGSYIKGLSSYSGTALFTKINAPENGEYVLTLTTRKNGNYEKFLLAQVNAQEKFEIKVPVSKSFTPEGRIQIIVKLQKGENHIKLYNPIGSKMDSSFMQYKKMGQALKRATKEYAEKNGVPEKPIVYSICEWGYNKPYKWGAEAGNLWRTTPDIMAKWFSIVSIYEHTVKLSKYSCIGGWNDPDMLEVGNGDLTYEENKSHFSLWCMMCAPLILGNDVRKFIKADGTVDTDNKVYQILTNKNLISINQDPLGIACERERQLSNSLLVDVLVKPLDNARVALCVFNKDTKEHKLELDIDKIINLPNVNVKKKEQYHIFDCWDNRHFDARKIVCEPEKHGCEVYIIE